MPQFCTGGLNVKESEVTFSSGELLLEGVLATPEGKAPFPAVVICHPHPLYGGSMDNNVVNSICEALVGASIAALKFNFRGVGRSQGEFNQGVGEQEDVSAAISFIIGVGGVDSAKIGLVGYSAGAGFGFPVGVEDSRIKAMAAVSPPLSMFDFKGLKDFYHGCFCLGRGCLFFFFGNYGSNCLRSLFLRDMGFFSLDLKLFFL